MLVTMMRMTRSPSGFTPSWFSRKYVTITTSRQRLSCVNFFNTASPAVPTFVQKRSNLSKDMLTIMGVAPANTASGTVNSENRGHSRASRHNTLCFFAGVLLSVMSTSAWALSRDDASRMPWSNHPATNQLNKTDKADRLLTNRTERTAATAKQILSTAQRILFPAFAPQRLHCEPSQKPLASVYSQEENEGEREDLLASSVKKGLVYVEAPLPARALESSHAIYGQLLKENLIESYQVFQRQDAAELAKPASPRATETLNGFSQSQVVSISDVVQARIRLGTNLDGHTSVVHGGILSLLIDDVLGFAYEALDIPMAVTANLNVNFRQPVMAGSSLHMTTHLVEWKPGSRKLYFTLTVHAPDDTSKVYCEASGLYIIPKPIYEQMTKMQA